MKRKFVSVAKRLGFEIVKYRSYRSAGMGGLQVFEVLVSKDSKKHFFTDSYFHLSGDAPKIIIQFEHELNEIK